MDYKISIVGVGKLGLPVAVCLARRFQVKGYDTNPELRKKRTYEHLETGPDGREPFQPYLDNSTLTFTETLEECITDSQLVFVAVQTPHKKEFDGSTRLPSLVREDFDYSYLVKTCQELAHLVKPNQTVAIISTVLPGTMTREIVPILRDGCKVVYSPLFIAMGTVMKDFNNPEFVLLGGSREDVEDLGRMYSQYHRLDNQIIMSYESAELTKTSYNLLISTKIAFSNCIAEMSHKIQNCNCDDVSNALCRATDRLISSKYMRGGLPDSGGCHPRDAIAMSFLAKKLNVHYNPFEQLAKSRELQCEFLVGLLLKHRKDLDIILLGKAFKPETNIVAGSAALLCTNILKERGIDFAHLDPFEDLTGCGYRMIYTENDTRPKAFLILTQHKEYKDWKFPIGSVVIDPFRYIPEQEGIELIPVGVGK